MSETEVLSELFIACSSYSVWMCRPGTSSYKNGGRRDYLPNWKKTEAGAGGVIFQKTPGQNLPCPGRERWTWTTSVLHRLEPAELDWKLAWPVTLNGLWWNGGQSFDTRIESFPKVQHLFWKSSKYFSDNIWQMKHIKISPEVNLEVGSKLRETLRKII